MNNCYYFFAWIVLIFTGCSSQIAMIPNKTYSSLTGKTGSLQSCAVNPSSRLTIPRRQIVYFDYDKSEITPKSRIILEEHAAYLRANPAVFIHLSGHADERGTNRYNVALAERRINEVKKMLIFLGVTESQFINLNYGEEQPVAFGNYEKSWRLNRRVKLIYPVNVLKR